MAIRSILTAPDPRLKVVSEPVEKVDAEIRTLVDDMIETMYGADGIGLAAIQVGVAKRVLVMDIEQKDGKKNPKAYINPKILWASEELATFEEGCLSVPEIWDEVDRLGIRTARIEIDDGDALGHADLDRGKADAVGAVHRLDHVVDKRADLRIDFRDGLGHDFQARIGRGQDGADGHGREIGFWPLLVKGNAA